MRCSLAALLLALGLALGQGLEATLVRALFTEPVRAEWFSEEFLAQVPAGRVAAIVKELKARLGAFEGVRKEGEDYLAVFEKGEVPVVIRLNAEGKIAGLFFKNPRQRLASLDEAKEAIKELPGRVHFLVQKNGADLAALAPDLRLAVGSAFKLSVLAALLDAVEKGERAWDEVHPLRQDWKSLPSGALEAWPAGTPLTLAGLAGRMIAESDNTAADHLVHLLGRGRVERFAYQNRPFLTTRAAFVLKTDPELKNRWLEGDEAARRAVLKEAEARPLPSAAELVAALPETRVEWFYSARELCDLARIALKTPLSGINPGLANKNRWRRVAYKGGSEPGVLNLTTALVARDGAVYCVVATWNRPEGLDPARLYAIYGGVLDLLARR